MVRPVALLAMAATLCTMQRAAAFLPVRLATVSARPSAALYARAGALRTLAMISTEAKGAAESMEYRVFFKVGARRTGMEWGVFCGGVMSMSMAAMTNLCMPFFPDHLALVFARAEGWQRHLALARHPPQGGRQHLQLHHRNPQVVSAQPSVHSHGPIVHHVGFGSSHCRACSSTHTYGSTKAKMEVSTKEELNPIAQDTKKGKLRYVRYAPPIPSQPASRALVIRISNHIPFPSILSIPNIASTTAPSSGTTACSPRRGRTPTTCTPR